MRKSRSSSKVLSPPLHDRSRWQKKAWDESRNTGPSGVGPCRGLARSAQVVIPHQLVLFRRSLVGSWALAKQRFNIFCITMPK